MFTDEHRVILYPKVNSQMNVIKSEEGKKTLHNYEENKKRTFYRLKLEISLMIAGDHQSGLSHLIFFSGIQKNFSYKQFMFL